MEFKGMMKMDEYARSFIGFIGAVITVGLLIIFNQSIYYMLLIIIIFGVWLLYPNKYFYVSSYKYRTVREKNE